MGKAKTSLLLQTRRWALLVAHSYGIEAFLVKLNKDVAFVCLCLISCLCDSLGEKPSDKGETTVLAADEEVRNHLIFR